MKSFIAILLLSVPAFAQSDWNVMDGAPVVSIQREGQSPEAEAIDGNVLSTSRPSFSFVIPAVASLRGANGTYFRSDLTLVNHKAVNQVVGIEWLPRGEQGDGKLTGEITIPPRTFYTYKNVLETAFFRTGMGALRFVSLKADRTIDPTGLIDGFSRVWTETPSGPGTVSQAFNPVSESDLVGPDQAVILGLRHDADYRTNVGIVNLDATQYHTWNVKVSGRRTAEFQITVAPNSMEQVALPAGDYGDIAITVTGEGNAIRNWTAYASTVDNRTGDGWVSRASQPIGQIR